MRGDRLFYGFVRNDEKQKNQISEQMEILTKHLTVMWREKKKANILDLNVVYKLVCEWLTIWRTNKLNAKCEHLANKIKENQNKRFNVTITHTHIFQCRKEWKTLCKRKKNNNKKTEWILFVSFKCNLAIEIAVLHSWVDRGREQKQKQILIEQPKECPRFKLNSLIECASQVNDISKLREN